MKNKEKIILELTQEQIEHLWDGLAYVRAYLLETVTQENEVQDIYDQITKSITKE